MVESLQVGSMVPVLDLVAHEITTLRYLRRPEYQPSVRTVLEFEAA